MNNNRLNLARGSYPGYIYLINAVGTNKFKIGQTCSPVAERINRLQTGCPFRLRYVYHAYVQNMNRTERELHREFHPFRSVGEWFALDFANVQECITLMRLVQVDRPRTPITRTRTSKVELEFKEEDTERVLHLRKQGWTKGKIILEVWGASRGGSPKYKAAEAEYKRLVEESA